MGDGEVTLTGTVNTRQEKFLAEELADAVSGVHDVHNQLRMKREQTSPRLGATESSSSGTETARTRNARA